jgi:hypothetical protein
MKKIREKEVAEIEDANAAVITQQKKEKAPTIDDIANTNKTARPKIKTPLVFFIFDTPFFN